MLSKTPDFKISEINLFDKSHFDPKFLDLVVRVSLV